MIFGNISNLGGAVAAGHVTEAASEKGSPAQGWDNSSEWRGSVHTVVKEDGRASHVWLLITVYFIIVNITLYIPSICGVTVIIFYDFVLLGDVI